MKEISCYLFSRFTLYIYLLILEIATNPRCWEQSFWKGRPLFEVDELTCSEGRGSWVFGECHAACMFQIIIESTPNQPHFIIKVTFSYQLPGNTFLLDQLSILSTFVIKQNIFPNCTFCLETSSLDNCSWNTILC